MSSHFRTISVVDANGDELLLYEFRERASLFGLVPKRRFQLCTGEAVEKRGDRYIVLSTGEKLTRITQQH